MPRVCCCLRLRLVAQQGDRVLARLYQILQRRLPKLHRHLSAIPGSAMIFYPWVKLLLKRQVRSALARGTSHAPYATVDLISVGHEFHRLSSGVLYDRF
jgi:uncharacterized membrane protein